MCEKPLPAKGSEKSEFVVKAVNVEIKSSDGVDKAPVYVVVGGSDITLKAIGEPKGGTCVWSISDETKVEIVGDKDKYTVVIRGKEASSSAEDLTVEVKYKEKDGEKTATAKHKITAIRVCLDVDANRDGVVEENNPNKNKWEWGKGKDKSGAIILCNNDDDNKNKERDKKNNKIDGKDDVKDLAKLVIRKTALPKGFKASLYVLDKTKIRIFDKYDSSGKAIIGPDPEEDEYEIPDITSKDLEYGMEGTQYPYKGFDGEIEIYLSIVDDKDNEIGEDEVTVRVAPWMMCSHSDEVEVVYVAKTSSNSDFVSDLDGIMKKLGITLQTADSINKYYTINKDGKKEEDQWMQDTMEIGYSNLPNHAIHAVLKSPRNRGLARFAEDELLGPEFGYQPVAIKKPNTFDSFGNLEVSPPVTVGGKNYEFGRIYYGPGDGTEKFNKKVKEFLIAQEVQSPIGVDTSWLVVGHVDEMMSFVPSNTGKSFRMLIASPDEAINILKRLESAGNGDLEMFKDAGIMYTVEAGDTLSDIADSYKISARDIYDHSQNEELRKKLKKKGHMVAGDKIWVPAEEKGVTINNILTTDGFIKFNEKIQKKLDNITKGLVKDFGLDKSVDIIKIPVLFVESEDLPGFADAYTPDMVNMLVVGNNCVIPNPFGPVDGDVDQFKKDVIDKLEPLGLNLHFINDWYTYHKANGEVHCGTNAKRKISPQKWWELQI
jgi:protein-arginine deiminase